MKATVAHPDFVLKKLYLVLWLSDLLNFVNSSNMDCENAVCAGYILRQGSHLQGTDSGAIHVNYTLPEENFQKELLSLAPCPPSWKLDLLCDPGFDKIIGCAERTAILINCLGKISLLTEKLCQVIDSCLPSLTCKSFTEYRNVMQYECSEFENMPLATGQSVRPTSQYTNNMTTVNNTAQGVEPSPPPVGAAHGEIVIILVVVLLMLFVALICLAYLCILRENRRRMYKWCCKGGCCRCKRRRIGVEDEIAIISNNHKRPNKLIIPTKNSPLRSKNPETVSIGSDVSLDELPAIGKDLDYGFGFADIDTPSEYAASEYNFSIL